MKLSKKLLVCLLILLVVGWFFVFKDRTLSLDGYEQAFFNIPIVTSEELANLALSKVLVQEGIAKISFQASQNNVIVYFDPALLSVSQVKQRLQKAGYRIVNDNKKTELQVLDYKVKYNPNY
ncbi:hypothetical protein DID80_00960 [Candidatus Marinamargulisbacteria bacterium SCGC AAA071-K20]|nr:hypothetical protein DID80_00960 [Candidatus Marinamargulisbacteria bacterium SCGC AAA071-K20]